MDPYEGRYRFCPRCRCEYRPGFQICSDCGADLVDELPPEPAAAAGAEPTPSLGPDPVAVWVTSRALDAEMVRGMLESAGLVAMVWRAGLEARYGSIGGVRVMVRREDAELARQLIRAAPEPAEGSDG